MPHFLCSRLNETLADACVAAKSFTGIETSPKETVAPAIALAMVCVSVIPSGIHAKNLHCRQIIMLRKESASAGPAPSASCLKNTYASS